MNFSLHDIFNKFRKPRRRASCSTCSSAELDEIRKTQHKRSQALSLFSNRSASSIHESCIATRAKDIPVDLRGWPALSPRNSCKVCKIFKFTGDIESRAFLDELGIRPRGKCERKDSGLGQSS